MLWVVFCWPFLDSGRLWGSEAGEIFLARGTKFYLDGQYLQAKEQLLQAATLDPQNVEIRVMLGVTCFALHDFLQARNALTTAISLDPRVPQGKLFLGATLYYLGEYRGAVRWLKEAEAETPEDGLVHYYLGLCAYQQNRPAEARSQLTIGYRQAPEYAPGFKSYERALEVPPPEPMRPFELTFSTGIEYDDNVKVLPDGTVLIGARQYKGHKADWRVPLMLRAEYRPLIKENFVWGFKYFVYGGLNFELDMFNVFNQVAEVYLKYRRGRFTFQPSYWFDFTLLGAERYSQFQNVGLRFSLVETPYLVGDLVYRFQYRGFRYRVVKDYSRSGTRHRVGLYQTIVLGSKGAWRIGGFWERELADVNWSSQRYGAITEITYTFPYQISAWGSFEYGRTNCDNVDTFFNIQRHNNYYEVNLQLRRPLTAWMNVIAGYVHVSDCSNISDFEYDRNIYQLLLSVD